MHGVKIQKVKGWERAVKTSAISENLRRGCSVVGRRRAESGSSILPSACSEGAVLLQAWL